MMLLYCAFLLVGFGSSVSARDNFFCKIKTDTNTTYDIAPLHAATYDALLVFESSLDNVSVATGWCADTVNSTPCNVTDGKLVITDASGRCQNAFSAIFGPPVTAPDGLLLQFYSQWTTAVANVHLICDQTIQKGQALLVGVIRRFPSYTYEMKFKTQHACPL